MRNRTLWQAIALAVLSGCTAGRQDYRPPALMTKPSNAIVIDRPIDVVWKELVSGVGRRFFVINNIDRTSGLINLSYGGDPELYIDCGMVESYVKNLKGERTYVFPGARAQQSYELMNNSGLYFVDRRMALDGRINVIAEELEQSKTRVTVNTRYIVTRTQQARRADGQVMGTLTHTTSFDAGDSGQMLGGPLVCRSTGRLENELLRIPVQ
jgi:hypothetical protein